MKLTGVMRVLWHHVQTSLIRSRLALGASGRAHSFGNLLVIAPHPDDEIFGVGGVILATRGVGLTVHILYLTDGEAAGVHLEPERIRSERMAMTETVRQALGIGNENLYRFHLPDGTLPHVGAEGFEAVAERLSGLIDQLSPDSVLATHTLDYWPYDHVACAELAQAAVARSVRRPVLYLYWVWAWYNLRPWGVLLARYAGVMAIDISPWAKAKRALVDLYLGPKTPEGTPWSGVLPAPLRRAFRFDIEVLERVEQK